MQQEAKRRRLVQAALSLTRNTPLAAGTYEQELLEQFIQQRLTIDEVITLLEASLAAADGGELTASPAAAARCVVD